MLYRVYGDFSCLVGAGSRVGGASLRTREHCSVFWCVPGMCNASKSIEWMSVSDAVNTFIYRSSYETFELDIQVVLISSKRYFSNKCVGLNVEIFDKDINTDT